MEHVVVKDKDTGTKVATPNKDIQKGWKIDYRKDYIVGEESRMKYHIVFPEKGYVGWAQTYETYEIAVMAVNCLAGVPNIDIEPHVLFHRDRLRFLNQLGETIFEGNGKEIPKDGFSTDQLVILHYLARNCFEVGSRLADWVENGAYKAVLKRTTKAISDIQHLEEWRQHNG